MSVVEFPSGSKAEKECHLAEVHTLYESNANDIVAMMREIADEIEEHDDTRGMVCLRMTDEGLRPYLWGKMTTPEALGYMEIAKCVMINSTFGSDEE